MWKRVGLRSSFLVRIVAIYSDLEMYPCDCLILVYKDQMDTVLLRWLRG